MASESRACDRGGHMLRERRPRAIHGSHYGNYAACHLAAGIRGFEFVEWDEADTAGLDTSAYSIEDGCVGVPDLSGFGLALDEDVFTAAVAENGFSVSRI